MNFTKDLPLGFAGANLVISRLAHPDTSYGPSYVRLTSLRVVLDPVP